MRKDSLLSKHAKTFYWAGLFLPKDTLKKCSHLYDFCRTLDDIADQKKELSFKKKQFKIFKTKFKKKNSSLPVIKNIWRLIEKENISKKIILDLFDGIESDLKKTVRVTGKNNLLLYSYRVAGTVGLMMAKILKVKEKYSLIGAINLGVAMQLTNIARDVIEDKKNKRFYINHDFNSIKKNSSLPVIKNIWRLIEKENISKKIILDLFDGIESDLKKTVRITGKNNLLLYSYRVAGTVGLMMAKILKVKDKYSLIGAINLGVAMQLTNIARDVIEDKKNNRFYINHDFNSIKKNIQMADKFYLYSLNSIRNIPIGFRFSILVARRIYRQIGYEILKEKNIRNYNKAGKVYVSKIKKCVQTFFSLIDFVQILCTKKKGEKNSNLYLIIKKKINLYERI